MQSALHCCTESVAAVQDAMYPYRKRETGWGREKAGIRKERGTKRERERKRWGIRKERKNKQRKE